MSYKYNFEVFFKVSCVGKMEDFCVNSRNISGDTAITIASRLCEADAWDYVNAICFKEMKDGTFKIQKTARFNNPTKSLKVTVTDNSMAPTWHTNFVNAVNKWQESTGAKSTNKKTIVQQFIEAEGLMLKLKVCEKTINTIATYVFSYEWKSFEDKTFFNLKY